MEQEAKVDTSPAAIANAESFKRLWHNYIEVKAERNAKDDTIEHLRKALTRYRQIDFGGEWVRGSRHGIEMYGIDDDEPWRFAEQALTTTPPSRNEMLAALVDRLSDLDDRCGDANCDHKLCTLIDDATRAVKEKG